MVGQVGGDGELVEVIARGPVLADRCGREMVVQVSHPRVRAFTLVELLVVVSIIGLLVALALPTLMNVRALALKAVCSSKMRVLAGGSATYVAEYNSYPHFATWPWGGALYVLDYPGRGQTSQSAACAWPKTYGVLQMLGQKGTHETNMGSWAYFWEADEIWHGALCPAMDFVAVLEWADDPHVGYEWGHPKWKPARHPAAIGYQWNLRLRANTPYGRWKPSPDTAPDELPNGALTQNVEWRLFLPSSPRAYGAQAIHPQEIANASDCAEAWDSPDFETLDWTNVNRNWAVECLMPGMFCGPHTENTRGWALINGARHPGSSNILYADGAVRADATRQVHASELGPCPSGTWQGLNVKSWEDWNATFGTVHHVIPDPRM